LKKANVPILSFPTKKEKKEERAGCFRIWMRMKLKDDCSEQEEEEEGKPASFSSVAAGGNSPGG
jgi:hypothetical protein